MNAGLLISVGSFVGLIFGYVIYTLIAWQAKINYRNQYRKELSINSVIFDYNDWI